MDWSYPLRAACERNPRLPALRYRGATTTFAELEERVSELAAGLADQGAAGATVAWILGNVPEAVALPMALARIGATSVPVNGRLTPDEIAFIVRDAGAGLLVSDDVAPPVPGIRALRLADLAAPGRDDWPDVPDDALATLLYTSGTTGFPKGVMRTHGANSWNVMNSALGSPRSPGDVELFNLPAFGIGLMHFAIPALLGGATLVLDDAFAADRVWSLLAHERVTHTFLAPTMISAMLDVEDHERFDLADLRTIFTAYEFSDRLRERALDRFGDRFIYMYGLTEAQLTCTRPGEFSTRPGSVGGAMGAMRVRVRGEDGAPRPVNEVGEITLHGPALMSGYHQRPDETAKALQDGWLHTGDLGFLDEQGDLHYAGRAKEMIKTGGFSVDPLEVERALLTVPEIAESAVVGVADEHWGEMVVAFVVAAPGGTVEEAEAIASCRDLLAGYKLPKRVRVVEALPVNATGKVARALLRERLATDPESPV